MIPLSIALKISVVLIFYCAIDGIDAKSKEFARHLLDISFFPVNRKESHFGQSKNKFVEAEKSFKDMIGRGKDHIRLQNPQTAPTGAIRLMDGIRLFLGEIQKDNEKLTSEGKLYDELVEKVYTLLEKESVDTKEIDNFPNSSVRTELSLAIKEVLAQIGTEPETLLPYLHKTEGQGVGAEMDIKGKQSLAQASEVPRAVPVSKGYEEKKDRRSQKSEFELALNHSSIDATKKSKVEALFLYYKLYAMALNAFRSANNTPDERITALWLFHLLVLLKKEIDNILASKEHSETNKPRMEPMRKEANTDWEQIVPKPEPLEEAKQQS